MAVRLSRIGPASLQTPPEGDVAWDMAYKLTVLVLTHKDHPDRWMPLFGLPNFLFSSAVKSALEFGSDRSLGDPTWRWTNYTFMCMILVQGRGKEMTHEEIVGRVELENVLMEVLYG